MVQVAGFILIAVLIYCLFWLIITALPYLIVITAIVIGFQLYKEHKGL